MMDTRAEQRGVGVAVAVAFVAAVSTGSAEAQGTGTVLETGTQLISGLVGQQSFDIGGKLEDAGGDLDEGLIYGGTYQYSVTARLAIEGAFLFSAASGEQDDGGPGENGDDGEDGDGTDDGDNGDNGDDGDDGEGDGGEVEDDDETDANTLYATGALVYHFREGGRLLPFVMGGGGFTTVDAGGTRETRFTGVVGGGVLFALTDRWLLRGDVRNHVHSVDVPVATPSGSSSGSRTVNDLSLSGGVSWRF